MKKKRTARTVLFVNEGNMNYTDRITSIKGIGDKTAKLFEKISVYTVRDLLDHFPRDYDERSSKN